MTEEEVQQMAPGLMQAYAPEEPEEKVEGRRPRRRNQDDPILALRKWVPRTRLGHAVMAGEILTYEQALAPTLVVTCWIHQCTCILPSTCTFAPLSN